MLVMGPRTRSTKSRDGARLAYWTLGEGPPLVYLAGGPWAHVELWSVPACREWYRLLGRKHRLVRYEVRGTGRSDREVVDFSLEAQLGDVEAVVEALGLARFDVFAAAAGPVAIELAARRPLRVERLALWCARARTADISSPRLDAWRALVDQDWTLMTETGAHLALGWSGGEEGRRSTAHLRASVSAETTRAALAAGRTHDVTGRLPSIDLAVLVLHRRGVTWVPDTVARELARALPRCRLVLLEGESTAPWLGDRAGVLEALETLLLWRYRRSRRRARLEWSAETSAGTAGPRCRRAHAARA